MSSETGTLEGVVVDDGEVDEEPITLPAPDETIFRMRQAILAGQHWFEALLGAIGRWRLPAEDYDGRHFEYLIGGEAFDWLVLAERLIEEIEDIVPRDERDGLLFDGRWPIEVDDELFALELGQAKHSAHLNYLYGVLVEEALQLSVEEEIHKENFQRAWGQDPRVDENMLMRVYGKPREQLYEQYRDETGIVLGEHLTYNQWKAFTYFLFKLRLRRQDKARVASDTRKGLAQLSRMELAVSARRRGVRPDEAGFAARFG